MRTTNLLLSLLFACAAFGQLTPGPNVTIEFWSAQLGDFNGDRLTDFVHGRVMLVNQGGGNFTRVPVALPDGDSVIETLDVNGDGLSDFLASDRPSAPPGGVAATKSYRLYIMGDGLVWGPAIELGQQTQHPYVADVNADGKDDLILAKMMLQGDDAIATKMTVMLSNGDGTFSPRPSFEIPPHPYSGHPLRLRTGDLNHDGFRDIVLRTAHTLAILLGTGNGDFAPVSTRYVPTYQFGNAAADVHDIDGDGHLDIALAGDHSIRAFLGDGTGRFPRVTSVRVEADRNIKLAFGQFVNAGRTEIVAGTHHGDLIVYAYENKKLREVARRPTEFLSTNVFVGAFMQPDKTDLYVSGSTWRDQWTNPRLFVVDPALPVAAKATAVHGRSRAVRGFAAGPQTNFDVELRGDACVTSNDRWSLWRDGIWGAQRSAERNVEMAHEGDVMSVRFTMPWASSAVVAQLERKGNQYVGTTYVNTACGSSEVAISVSPR